MRAFYAGSFDPFTKGHLAICLEIIANCDELVIGVGKNSGKKLLFPDANKRIEMIKSSLEDFSKQYSERKFIGAKFTVNEAKAASKLCDCPDFLQIIEYDGSTVLAAKEHECDWLFRGERPLGDHENETMLAEANRNISNIMDYSITQCLIPSPRPELANISSTLIKGYCEIGQFIAAQKCVMPSVHNELMAIYLKPFFVEAISKLAPDTPDVEIERIFCKLAKKYSSSSRKYHNLTHLAYGINLLINSKKDMGFLNFILVMLAYFYHDYIMGDENNEELSCGIFNQEFNGKEIHREWVNELIMTTTHSSDYKADTEAKKIIADIDLAILSDEDNYGIYAHHIAQEYENIQKGKYVHSRLDFLSKMIEKAETVGIFQSACFGHEFNAKAIENMQHEKLFWLQQL